MNERKRRTVKLERVKDVTELGQITKEELLADHEKYDRDNYNPLNNLDEKEVLLPANKTRVITIRLSEKENEKITKIALENGLSKSAFVRMLVTRSLKKSDFL